MNQFAQGKAPKDSGLTKQYNDPEMTIESG